MDRVPVCVHAEDAISRLGVVSQTRTRPEVLVVERGGEHNAAVVLVVADSLDEEAARALRRLHRMVSAKLVLVPAKIDDAGLSTAVECGVVGVVRRGEATPERLVDAISSAVRGGGAVPADLLGRLVGQMGRLQRPGLNPRGLTLLGPTAPQIGGVGLGAGGFVD